MITAQAKWFDYSCLASSFNICWNLSPFDDIKINIMRNLCMTVGKYILQLRIGFSA